MNLASSSRPSTAAALPTDPLICNARVPQAIGQSFDWLVPAEAEVLGAGVADRPAAFRPAELDGLAGRMMAAVLEVAAVLQSDHGERALQK
jgi:hypothetical protein